jgi:Ca-activated chloride channel family protein
VKASRVIAILVAVALVAGGLIWRFAGSGDSGGGGGGGTVTEAPEGAVEVPFVYSPEKRPLLEPLLAEYNAAGREVGGRPVFVRGEVVSSGDSADKIDRGVLRPVLWSPASSLWGRLLNYRADQPLVADENPSLVRTPLVIAMWEPLARALGWPAKPLGWKDILREARSEEGWAAYGHPEWGRFKFGHTNPDFSTSGLSAVAAEYLSAAGKTEGLTLADVRDPAVRTEVRDIQRSVVHYGDTTLFFAERMKEQGPSYVSAVAMEEVTVLDFNRAPDRRVPRLAAIYPKEGTFFSDNPLIVLNGDWVTPEQKAAAQDLIAFLQEKVTPQRAAELSFRPSDPDARPLPPVTTANLVDPAKPTRLLSLPEPRVLNAITGAWRQDRKPAYVQVVLDISGSMNDEGKLEGAKQGLERFLDLMQPQDLVGLTVFSDRVTVLAPPRPIRTDRAVLKGRIRNLIADGGTAVYDATLAAQQGVARGARPDRISAVVVLTDGADNQSRAGIDQVLRELRRRSGSEGDGVRVFTIAYGSDAEREKLQEIARAGGGAAYSGDPATIERVYTQIASFF